MIGFATGDIEVVVFMGGSSAATCSAGKLRIKWKILVATWTISSLVTVTAANDLKATEQSDKQIQISAQP